MKCRSLFVMIIFTFGINMPLSSHEVNFYNGKILLRGTLYKPDTPAKSSAVVILGGSERSARNPYKEKIADDFVKIGIAALIYDSPGTGQSTGNALIQTKDDRITEAMAAMQFLRSQKGIDAEKVGIWGLSEGGSIALLTAAKDNKTAFCIAVSSALGLSPLDISRFRIELSGHEMGLSNRDIQKALVLEEILFEMMSGAGMAEWRLLKMKIKAWDSKLWNDLIELVRQCRQVETEKERVRIQESLKRTMKPWLKTAWFKLAVVDVRRFEQVFNLETNRFYAFLEKGPWARGDWNDHLRAKSDLAGINCPILAIWGEYDRYLPPHRSAATLRYLLSKNAHLLTVHIIPKTSHIMTRFGRDVFVEDYPHRITDWLKKIGFGF